MTAPRKPTKTTDSYIISYPKEIADKLKLVRATIKKVATQATEAISYGIPTFKLNGNLIHFAAFKNHIGLYPGAAGVKAFKKEIASYRTSKGAIQFPLDKPLPLPLIKKITQYRVKVSLAKKSKTCSRGHLFERSSEYPTCPICWPGRYKKKTPVPKK